MSFWQALVMGIIQGLAEFLPISSSGHLVLFRHILGINADVSSLFEVLLHVGTLGAVFVVFWEDVRSLIFEAFLLIGDAFMWLIKRKKIEMYPARKMVLLILVSSIPTAIIGLIIEVLLEDFFLSSLVAVGVALIVTAAILYAISKMPVGKKKLGKMKYDDALFIGIVQGISVIPGISRSGSTVAAGIFSGLDKEFAFKYSFLVSIPAILGAAVLKLFSITAADSLYMIAYLAGAAVAFAVGYFSITFLRYLVRKDKYYYFSYYCILAGFLAILIGVLK